MKKSEYALITENALNNGIGFAYKRDAQFPKDSGWRFQNSSKENVSDLDDPEKVFCISRKSLFERFPEVDEIIKTNRGNVYRYVNGEWRRISRDNSFSTVPHMMTVSEVRI